MKDEKLLETAKKRFSYVQKAEASSRSAELEDLKFVAGDQWPEAIKKQRDADQRPCLTINKLPQYIHQITNDQRQNRPAIKIRAASGDAHKDAAKMLDGLIRHIEVSSDADIAWDTAHEAQVRSGLGYVRILTEYEDTDSFNQIIKFSRIRNRFSVYMDPDHQQPDGSDAKWCFVSEKIHKDEFKVLYPKAEVKSWEPSSLGEDALAWVDGEELRVSEYFYTHYEDKTLYLIDDGTPNGKSVFDAPKDAKIIKERSVRVPTIKWCKLTAFEVLEEKEWAGKYIPIIEVSGDELDIEGKVIRSGVVRFSKDSQRQYNFWNTAMTEMIALAPKAPWVIEENQVEGYEEKWAQSNVRNFPYLKYKATPGAPPPIRQPFAQPPRGAMEAMMTASEDMKETTGIYGAGLGAPSNERSAKHYNARVREGDVGSFHYIDNLTRSIRHAGRILVDLVPKIYDMRRALMILGEDGTESMVTVAPIGKAKGVGFDQNQNQITIYDPSVGKYDVAVTTGPSYTTKRVEAAESMMQFTQAAPQTVPLIADLIAKNMDWPGADEIAARLKTMLPPQLHQVQQGDIPPEVQQMLQQLQQQNQQMQQAIGEMQKELQSKDAEHQISMYTQDTKRMEAQAKMQHVEAKKMHDDIIAMRELMATINEHLKGASNGNTAS